MISSIRTVGSASIEAEAGFICSVRSFSSIRLFPVSSYAGLLHDGSGGYEAQARAFFRQHVLQPAAEDLGAYAVRVTDLLEGPEKACQIDDAFARQEALIVLDLVRE